MGHKDLEAIEMWALVGLCALARCEQADGERLRRVRKREIALRTLRPRIGFRRRTRMGRPHVGRGNYVIEFTLREGACSSTSASRWIYFTMVPCVLDDR